MADLEEAQSMEVDIEVEDGQLQDRRGDEVWPRTRQAEPVPKPAIQ